MLTKPAPPLNGSGEVAVMADKKPLVGDRLLIAGGLVSTVIALHKNGSVRVRLEDGREADGWPERATLERLKGGES